MRRLAALLIGLLLSLSAQAQGALSFSTSGGLTIAVPDGYLVAEVGPLRVGITDIRSGASLLFSLIHSTAQPDDILAAELRRLGVAPDLAQPRALSARTSNAVIDGTRGTRAAGSVLVATVAFSDGSLALLTIQPADSVPLPVIKAVIESVRVARLAPASAYPACGSPELPQTITTSGGLTVCFPAGYTGEEKGPTSAAVANFESGVIVSVYARGDLQSLVGAPQADASATISAFTEVIRAAGAVVFDTAVESFELDNASATSFPVAYPKVGSGRIITAQLDSEVIVLSAVLIGTPPSDVVSTLNAIANSMSLGEGSEELGTVRTANRVINLGPASFTTAPGWTLVSLEGGQAALEGVNGSVLMSVASAPIDSSWNANSYKANVLAAAAQFAGDTAFDPAALEIVAGEDGRFALEAYDSSIAVPSASAAVNLTLLLTIDERTLIVFQATASRETYTPAIREDIVSMALSAVD